MANRPVSTTNPAKKVARSQWTALGSANGAELVGDPENYSGYAKVTVQVKGVFAGASLSILGSHDGSNYQILNDDRGEGNAATFTAANIVQLNEIPRFIRPEITAAASNLTSIDVEMVARGKS